MMNNLRLNILFFFISFSSLYGQSDCIELNYKLRVFDVHSVLKNELDEILCNCNSELNENKIRGFYVQCVKVKGDDVVIILPLYYEELFSETTRFFGVYLVEDVPFVFFNSYALEPLLIPLEEDYEFKCYRFENISTDFFHIPEYPVKKEVFINGQLFRFIFINCNK